MVATIIQSEYNHCSDMKFKKEIIKRYIQELKKHEEMLEKYSTQLYNKREFSEKKHAEMLTKHLHAKLVSTYTRHEGFKSDN